MVNSSRVCFIQDHLALQQSTVNEEVYKNKFGLFLADDQASELEAIISCDNHGSCGDSSISGSYGYHRSVLTNVDEIRASFAHDQRGLVVLHVSQQHSFSRLKITQPCFDQLLRSANIYHALKDNILHIGFRNMDVEVAPPAPSSRFLYDVEAANSPICGLEIAYGLRFIECNERNAGDPWSLRQCVIYNKTHYARALSQWVFFCLPKILRKQVDENLETFQRDLVLRPFDIHLMIFSSVAKMWRPYFIHIAQEIESCRRQVNMSNPRSHKSLKNVHEDTLLILKDYENDMLDAMLAIRATKRTLANHQSVWLTWCASQQTSNDQSGTSSLEYRFSELCQSLDGALEQAQSLLEKVRSICDIIASFLALASGYSTEGIAEQSKVLAEESKRLTELSLIDSFRMKKLTETAQKDTKAVKALSVITLIYLPITVVLNFFSSSFVHQDHGNVQIAGRWWLIVATSLPLTVFTLIAWGIWTCRKKLRRPSTDLEVGVSPITLGSDSGSPISSLGKA